MQKEGDDRSLADLFAELARETSTLVRQEVDLAVSELTDKIATAGKSAAALVVGGVIAHTGLLALVAALILMLEVAGMPLWVAALVVGIAAAAGGYLLVKQARAAMMRTDLVPRRAVRSLHEDADLVKERVRL